MLIAQHIPKKVKNYNFKHVAYPYTPFFHQRNVFESIYDNNILLQSPTSSGKTASVVYPIVDLVKDKKCRSIFVYPTRALLWDQYKSISEVAAMVDLDVAKLDPFTPTKVLYEIFAQNRLICMTPDIFYFTLLRNAQHYKRFYERSIESVRHIVFDEVHLYNTYMLFNLRHLLKVIEEINNQIKLHFLSATIDHVREKLEQVVPLKMINGEGFTGEVEIKSIFMPAFQVNGEIEKIFCQGGRKVVILNSAKRAQEAYDVIKTRFSDVYFAVGQRFQPENERNENLNNFNQSPNGILVASPVVEQGVDFKAEWVISEDADTLASIIQRFGRIGRGGLPGKFVILAKTAKRHQFFNQDIRMTRAEFERLLEDRDGGSYYNPPLPDEVEMMEAMLWKVWQQTQFKDTFEKIHDLLQLEVLYRKYEKYLPDVSFREPSPGVELKSGNIVSIWDVLKRDAWKMLTPNKGKEAVGYLALEPEEFLRSDFIKYTPSIKLTQSEIFNKTKTKSYITGAFEIRGVKFKNNGTIYKTFSYDSFKITQIGGPRKNRELFFKPEAFFNLISDEP